MKKGMFGFSRKEVLTFTLLFISSIILMVFCVISLISKYYNHNSYTHSEINKYSQDLSIIQEINLCAVNTQRSSLNIIIYANDPDELKSAQASVQKNRDSLIGKLEQLVRKNNLETSLRTGIEQAGYNYLTVNAMFLEFASNKEQATSFNVTKVRPVLRKFNDFTSQTAQFVTKKIQRMTDNKMNIFLQYEFWLLIIVVSPYFYFLFRFLYLLIKMILWDIFL